MRHTQDEVMEAVWAVSETASPTIEAVRNRCAGEFDEQDLAELEKSGKLIRDGSQLLLTAEGKHRARGLVRCHRLAETLLYTVFDLNWQKREEIACEMEHTLVPELADGICTLLGHPTECPDGKPIPPGNCCVAHQQVVGAQVVPLCELEAGSRARILYVKSKQANRLYELTSAGLTPGVVLTLTQRTPAYSVQYEGTTLALDRGVAADIFVSPIGDNTNQDVTQLTEWRKPKKNSLLRRFGL